MKRIFILLICIVMAFTMVSCGEKTETKVYTLKEESYSGTINYTVKITGDRIVVSAETTAERELDDGKMVYLKQTSKISGFVVKNEDGTINIDINRAGASASMSRLYTGDGADEMKAQLREQVNNLYEDGAAKQAQLDVIDGKTIVMKYGDELWEELGPDEDYSMVITLDEENGTFTYES